MNAAPEWKIPLTELCFGEEEEQGVLDVLRSRWLTMGPRTAEFERAVADAAGVEHAVFLSSCTAGLHLLLQSLDIGPGDEVLVPSLTFVATVNVVVNRGATPVFCDIVSPELPLISPLEIKRNLSSATRAVITVDYAGYPCDYDAISNVIADFESAARSPEPGKRFPNVSLLEDAAHGIGGMLDEQRCLGACADAGVFSFFSNKNLVTGEGGMIVTNRTDIAETARLLRRHGLTLGTWERHMTGPMEYDTVLPGWNFRPTELHAALGLAQLKRLDDMRTRRSEVVRRYGERLHEIKDVTVPLATAQTWHAPACHIMPILLPDRAARVRVREALQSKGVQTSHHYPPIHTFEYYRLNVPTAQVTLPETENYSDRELTLPLYPGLTPDQIDYIATEIKNAL